MQTAAACNKLSLMKKLFTALSLLVLSSLLYATTIGTGAIAMGGTMKNDAFLLGLGGTVINVTDYNDKFSMGIGAHLDISWMLRKHDTDGLFAAVAGPGLDIRPVKHLSLSIVIGPGMVAEGGSFGIGFGLDVAASYFFNASFGISAGITNYHQFYINDKDRDTDYSFAGNGYVGVAWRMQQEN